MVGVAQHLAGVLLEAATPSSPPETRPLTRSWSARLMRGDQSFRLLAPPSTVTTVPLI